MASNLLLFLEPVHAHFVSYLTNLYYFIGFCVVEYLIQILTCGKRALPRKQNQVAMPSTWVRWYNSFSRIRSWQKPWHPCLVNEIGAVLMRCRKVLGKCLAKRSIPQNSIPYFLANDARFPSPIQHSGLGVIKDKKAAKSLILRCFGTPGQGRTAGHHLGGSVRKEDHKTPVSLMGSGVSSGVPAVIRTRGLSLRRRFGPFLLHFTPCCPIARNPYGIREN